MGYGLLDNAQDFIDRQLPVGTTNLDSDTVRRARLVVMFSFAIVGIGGVFALSDLKHGRHMNAGVIATAIAFGTCAPALFR